jgi:trimeric autotransporter adhesin
LGALVAVGVCLLVLPLASAAAADGPLSVPLYTFPITDGPVYAEALSGSTLYIGGNFSNVGPHTGSFATFATSSGQRAHLPPVTGPNNGEVLAIVSDGVGGWYLGGDFTSIGGITRNRIAHITAAGEVDPNFDPNANDSVESLALSADGKTLYVGGGFSMIGGQAHADLAALSTADGGAVSSFDPNPNGDVGMLALSPDGQTLYTGGDFTSIGGQSRNYLAAVSTADGNALSSFNPGPDRNVQAIALSPDGKTLYAGGYFTSIGGQSRFRLAALSTGDGSALSSFAPSLDPNGLPAALELSPDGNTLYVGGQFATLDGQTRNGLGALSTADGSLISSFDPKAESNTQVQALALSADGKTLYVGGPFGGSIGGQTRHDLAALSTADGTATSFSPEPSSEVNALAVSPDGGGLGVGGSFTWFPVERHNLAAINVDTGEVTSFNPDPDSDVRAFAVSPDGETLYVGGGFHSVGGQSRNSIAALSTTDGTALSSFNPGFDIDNSVSSLALSPDGTTLYVGGAFGYIGGQTDSPYLAAVSTSDGSALASFRPDPDCNVNQIALSSDGQTLYFDGCFGSVGTQTRHNLAAVATADGSVVPSFDPEPSGAVGPLALSSDGQTLYAGGAFYAIGGLSRDYLAALSTANGSALAAFDPNPNANGYLDALALSSDGQTLYAGGDFTSIGGQSRNYLAALRTADGSALSFNPSPSASVDSLTLSGSDLYVGGSFGGFATTKGAAYLARIPGTPQATITSHPDATTTSGVAEFGFSSSEPESSYDCSLDGSAFTLCTSPANYSGLSAGAHTFAVEASINGITGPQVSYSWTVQGHTLTIAKTGHGTGAVESSPAGIDCGTGCSHAFPVGTLVTLTATPAAGSTFTGWSAQGCPGTGTCAVTMNSATSVTANFQTSHPQLPRCVAPNLKGKSLKSAKTRIKANHCAVGHITHAFSKKVKNRHVISQKPRPGMQLHREAKINLIVSRGKRP